jgi:hypothetical protein
VYPDGSKNTLWLPDATVEHGTNKHAVLFFIAILILVVGFIYSFALFVAVASLLPKKMSEVDQKPKTQLLCRNLSHPL